jgi:hypothetical protein
LDFQRSQGLRLARLKVELVAARMNELVAARMNELVAARMKLRMEFRV